MIIECFTATSLHQKTRKIIYQKIIKKKKIIKNYFIKTRKTSPKPPLTHHGCDLLHELHLVHGLLRRRHLVGLHLSLRLPKVLKVLKYKSSYFY